MKTITLYAVLLIFVLSLQFQLEVGRQDKSNVDLEIYTSHNIYYVRGLSVTSETGENEKDFKNKEDLKEYLSDITAQESLTTH